MTQLNTKGHHNEALVKFLAPAAFERAFEELAIEPNCALRPSGRLG